MRSSAIHFQAGDVLYSRLRPYLNKVILSEFEGLCSAEFIVLPPSPLVYGKYLQQLLSTAAFVRFASHLNTGDRPRVDFEQIGDFVVPVPPLDEQHRIVAAIEEHLSELDAALEGLRWVQAQVPRYRAAVLKAACEGRLVATAETRRRVRLGDISSLITSGSRGWAEYYAVSGPLFIRAQDIKTDRLILDGAAHVDPPTGGEGTRTRVDRGDLLVTITGANVTKSAIVDREIGEAYVSQHVALVRLKDPAWAKYVYSWLVAPSHGRRQLEQWAYGAGKPGLNLGQVRSVEIELPSAGGREAIVNEVERCLSLADAAELAVASSLARTAALRQAILQRAFEGTLVPQDPTEESTEQFLARSRFDSAQTSAHPQRRSATRR